MFDMSAAQRLERISFDKPLVKDAYDKLGVEEVRAMNYRVSNIKRAIIVKSKMADDVKITRLVNTALPKQNPIPAKRVKQFLQETYKDLGIESKAKATDLAK
jgi:hypothetical protein